MLWFWEPGVKIQSLNSVWGGHIIISALRLKLTSPPGEFKVKFSQQGGRDRVSKDVFTKPFPPT